MYFFCYKKQIIKNSLKNNNKIFKRSLLLLKNILIKYHNKKLLNKKDNNKIFKRSLLQLKDILIKYYNKKPKISLLLLKDI